MYILINNRFNNIINSVLHNNDKIILSFIGGSIGVHYDASLTGWINYKCNLSVLSDDYKFYIDKDVLEICSGDLYCFEASLYKHWSDVFSSRRVLLSFGFILPYYILGRKSDEPRVRLSQRIEKYFQS